MTNISKIEELIKGKEDYLKKAIPVRYSNVDITEVKDFELGKSYYIWGGVGTGKTRLAYGLVKKSVERNYELTAEKINKDTENYAYHINPPVKFYNFPKMLTYIKNSIGADKNYSDTLNIDDIAEDKRLVIIDDLGAEKFTEWVIETLYQIINERYENMLPTIFISNLSLGNLSEKVGDRISSRIAEMCEVRELKGNDRRI
jgi:DNA replication protein DnaC